MRVYEEFATLDLVSSGRAEIIAGRGVFSEPFPLFGYDLHDYEALFDEKLALFDLLNKSERVTWKGRFRTPLNDAEIAPRALQPAIPLWIGVGGSPDSAIRAGRLGLPMALAVLGGPYSRAAQLAALYRDRRTRRRARRNIARRRQWTSSHCRVVTGGSRQLLSLLQSILARINPYKVRWTKNPARGFQSVHY